MAIAAEHFSSGTTASKQDTRRYLLCKILMATVASGGGVGAGGVFDTVGFPVLVPTTATAIAIDHTNGAVYYWYLGAWH
jgi:hypothetical protein